MFIKSLKLENIRSYINAEIDFPKGITLLSGDIGSGKSTILLAIEFGLFGINKGELSGSALLRKGSTQGTIELAFTIAKKEIIIKRILKKSKTGISQGSSYIIIDNVKKEATPIELKSKVLELLGYPHDIINKKNLIFRYTVYTPQEEMKRIIQENKDERLNILRKVFGIDRYKLIRENSAILIKKLKDECRKIEGFIADIEIKKASGKELTQRIDAIKLELKPLIAKEEASNKDIKETETKQKEIKEKFTEYIEYKNNITALESEMNEILRQKEQNNTEIKILEKDISEISVEKVDTSNKDDIEKKIAEKEKNILNIRQKIVSLDEKISLTSAEIDRNKDYIKENKEKISDIRRLEKSLLELAKEIKEKPAIISRNEKITKEVLILEKTLSSLISKLESSEEIISKMNSLNECPVCLQKVDSQHKTSVISKETSLITEFRSQKKSMIIQKDALAKKSEELVLNIKEIEMKERQSSATEIKLNSLKLIQGEVQKKEAELNKHKDNLALLTEQKKTIMKDDPAVMQHELNVLKELYKKIIDYYAKSKIIEEKKNNLSALEEKNTILKKRVSEINRKKLEMKDVIIRFKDIESIMAETENILQERKDALKQIELEMTEKNTRISSMQEENARIGEEISRKEQEKKNLTRKKQYIDWLNESFVNIISIIEKNILANLYNEFNSLFQEWFDILIEDELILAKLDDEFSPSIQQNGYDTEIENLSGGEKTALALAYRLALNKVINDITTEVNTKDLIILDEPTDGFSEQQLDKIRDVLERLNMNQIIIVSHESKIESFVDNIIRISKQEHSSSIV